MAKLILESRVKFPAGKQREFLQNALSALMIKQSILARIANVSERTLRDWKREKYNISYSSLKAITEWSKLGLPKNIKILPQYWSVEKASILGGKKYAEVYGSPGTPNGRRKGGLATQKIFRHDPEIAKQIGILIRKKINKPKKSAALAEFIGIMLGDGSISNNYQIAVSFNHKEDMEHARYIQKLIFDLFHLSSTICIRKSNRSGDIQVTSRNLVEFLIDNGVKKGNKIANKVDIPSWILDTPQYKISCLRGLMDTDGGLFHHRYVVKGKEYTYLKMCFTSYSPPLLKSVEDILEELDLNPKNTAKNRVYLYSLDKIKEYFTKVGTNNSRYLNTYNNFLKLKASGGVAEWTKAIAC